MSTQNTMDRIILAWSLLVCGYVFLIPVSHNAILISLSATLGVIAVSWFIRRRAHINSALLVPAAIWIVFVLYSSVTAGLFGAASWPRVMVFMFVLPIFYFLLVSVFRRSFIRPLFYLGVGVSILIGAALVSQSAVTMGKLTFLTLPKEIYDFIDLEFAVDPSGPLRFSSSVLTPVLWWGAIWMASIFVDSRDAYLPPMAYRAAATVLCLTAAVLSLRRGIIVVLVLTPVTIAATALALYAKNCAERTVRFGARRVLILAGTFLSAATIVLAVQPNSYQIAGASVQSIVDVLGYSHVDPADPTPVASSSENDGDNVVTPVLAPSGAPLQASGSNLEIKGTYDTVRQNEARILLSPGNVRNAIFGRGLGATIERGSDARGDLKDRPWQSELSYLLLFYWSGLIGVALCATVAITGFRALRLALGLAGDLNGALFVATVGAAALLLANGANPYMQAMGHLWPLFFPFMIANAILRPDRITIAPVEPDKPRVAAASN